MKPLSKITISFSVVLALFAALAVTSQAQNRERYIISAKAGGINYVSGSVVVARRGSTRDRNLTAEDNLGSGDVVKTWTTGRVEVLLNPGSYMRVAENSEFEFTDTSLEHLLVTLFKGHAVVEVTGEDSVTQDIRIATPGGEATIIRGGIYRFNALANGTAEILVRKGRISVGQNPATIVKDGKKIVIGKGLLEVTKLNKKELDDLDVWSKDRAEMLAQVNRRLQRRPLLTAFNDFSWNSWPSWTQANRQTLGVWVYNPIIRSHCFLPTGSRGWSSPYGHHYGTGVGGGWSGRDGRSGGNGAGWGNQGGGSGGNSGGGSGSGSGSGSSGNSGNGSGGNSGHTSPPPAPQQTYTPPPSPPPSTMHGEGSGGNSRNTAPPPQ